MHEILGLVGLDTIDIDQAHVISQWGQTSGCLNYVKGLAIFCVRVGRRWQVLNGDYERALGCIEIAQTIFEDLHLPDNVAQCLFDKGRIYQEIGDRTAALANTETAYDMYTDLIMDHPERAKASWQKQIMVLDQVSAIYLGMPNAPTNLQRSIERLEELQKTEPTVESLDLFGGDTFATTVRDQVQMRLELSRVMAPVMLAGDQRAAGYPEEAAKLLQKAYALTADVSPDQKDFLRANVLRVSQRYDEASQTFQHFLDAGGVRSNYTGALVEKTVEKFADAGQALADGEKSINHGLAFQFFVRTKHYDLALRHQQAIDEEGRNNWLNQDINAWERLSTYGELQEGLENFPEALEFYDAAIKDLENRRTILRQDHLRAAFAGTVSVQALYFYAARTATKLVLTKKVDSNLYTARALQYTEQGRTRALLDMVASQSSTNTKNTSQLRQLNARLSQYQKLLTDELNTEHPRDALIDRYRRQITADEQDLARLKRSLPVSITAQVSTLKKLKSRVPDHTLLLEYYYLEDDLLIFGISSQNVNVRLHKIDNAELNQMIRRLLEAIENQENITRQGTDLSSILLDPFRDEINACERLIIVPYGFLYRLPFHTLPWADNQPLITTHIVSQLPSASIIEYIQTPSIQPATSNALVVGNPSAMAYTPVNTQGKQIVHQTGLPAAEMEAVYVAAQFDSSTLLFGETATKVNFLKNISHRDVIHLATHSILFQDTPLLSAILLANGEGLTVDEIMGMDLETQLIVLSACDTAKGEITRGGDVDGLIRGVLSAGAHSTLLSLWPVNDVSTSLLMGKFYDRLRISDTAQAFQQAQNDLRTMSSADIQAAKHKLRRDVDNYQARNSRFGYGADDTITDADQETPDYRKPYYWAAFVYIGI